MKTSTNVIGLFGNTLPKDNIPKKRKKHSHLVKQFEDLNWNKKEIEKKSFYKKMSQEERNDFNKKFSKEKAKRIKNITNSKAQNTNSNKISFSKILNRHLFFYLSVEFFILLFTKNTFISLGKGVLLAQSIALMIEVSILYFNERRNSILDRTIFNLLICFSIISMMIGCISTDKHLSNSKQISNIQIKGFQDQIRMWKSIKESDLSRHETLNKAHKRFIGLGELSKADKQQRKERGLLYNRTTETADKIDQLYKKMNKAHVKDLKSQSIIQKIKNCSINTYITIFLLLLFQLASIRSGHAFIQALGQC